MSEQLTGAKLIVGEAYFLVGYLDEKCAVPFIRTLIYQRSQEHKGDEIGGVALEHVFADAIAWFGSGDGRDLDPEDTVWIAENDLEGIKTLPGLVDELGQRA